MKWGRRGSDGRVGGELCWNPGHRMGLAAARPGIRNWASFLPHSMYSLYSRLTAMQRPRSQFVTHSTSVSISQSHTHHSAALHPEPRHLRHSPPC